MLLGLLAGKALAIIYPQGSSAYSQCTLSFSSIYTFFTPFLHSASLRTVLISSSPPFSCLHLLPILCPSFFLFYSFSLSFFSCFISLFCHPAFPPYPLACLFKKKIPPFLPFPWPFPNEIAPNHKANCVVLSWSLKIANMRSRKLNYVGL